MGKELFRYEESLIERRKDKNVDSILKLICKLTGNKVPKRSSDAYIIAYMMIGIFLGYSTNELMRLSASASTDTVLTTSYSLSEFVNIIPIVLSRSVKIQNEFLNCIAKRTLIGSYGYFTGKPKEKINLIDEATKLFKNKLEFTKKEVLEILSTIPENIGLDIDISQYVDDKFDKLGKDMLFQKIENTSDSDSLIVEYKGIQEYCPNFHKPFDLMINQEISNAIGNIKSRVKNEIEIHKMLVIKKADDISFASGVVFLTVILCLILFSETFIIRNIVKCFKIKNENLRKCRLCGNIGHDARNCPDLLEY